MLLLLALWSLPVPGAVGEPDIRKIVPPGVANPPQEKPGPEPWIGLEVAPLTDAMRAHVSKVPKGVGFVVTGVRADGPAAEAGLRRFDIFWKFEDQLLINEAQLGTLIRLHAPGDEVDLDILRAGESKQIRLAIGEMPEEERRTELNPSEIPIFPTGIPGMPRQVVYPGNRTAEITREDGSIARLRYEEDVAVVRIEDAEGEVVFDGPIRQEGKFAVPDEWRCTVGALLRTIHRSEQNAWQPRRPRPRVIMPPQRSSSDG